MEKEKGKRKSQESSKRKEQRKITTRWKPTFWTKEPARMADGWPQRILWRVFNTSTWGPRHQPPCIPCMYLCLFLSLSQTSLCLYLSRSLSRSSVSSSSSAFLLRSLRQMISLRGGSRSGGEPRDRSRRSTIRSAVRILTILTTKKRVWHKQEKRQEIWCITFLNRWCGLQYSQKRGINDFCTTGTNQCCGSASLCSDLPFTLMRIRNRILASKSGFRIRIRIGSVFNRASGPDPGGQKWPTKVEKNL